MTDTTKRGPRPIDDRQADALLDMYRHLEERARKNGEPKGGFADMDEDERRAYMREAKRRSRQRQGEKARAGFLEPTADNVRSALADAAIRILKDDGPGSDVILDTLRTVFDDKPGVPLTVATKVRTGRLKPRLWRSLKLHPHLRRALARTRKAEDVPGDAS